MQTSIIYRNIAAYRLTMELLYFGGYKRRFKAIVGQLKPDEKMVLELCFGDTVIAQYCRQLGKSWTGFDISEAFITHAVGKGYDAQYVDVLSCQALPVCDVCIMMGSLYHFVGKLPELFQKVSRSSRRFIISEPIRNWTNVPGPLSFLARRLTRAGKGDETFRFNHNSLVEEMCELRKSIPFNFTAMDCGRDMILEVAWLK